jgi:hypothetical protein
MRPGMAAVRLLVDRHALRSGVGRTGSGALAISKILKVDRF